jgi:hypothetical protein
LHLPPLDDAADQRHSYQSDISQRPPRHVVLLRRPASVTSTLLRARLDRAEVLGLPAAQPLELFFQLLDPAGAQVVLAEGRFDFRDLLADLRQLA